VAKKIVAKEILGEHPQVGLGSLIIASDDHTKSGVPHRALTEYDGQREAIATCIREMLMRHHASPETLEREKKRIESMKHLGYEAYQRRMSRFPINPNTQKGRI
jgi:Zn/Cd-binding protein ZinT